MGFIEELQRQLEHRNSLLAVVRRLGTTTDLNAILELIIHEAIKVLNAERGTVFLYDVEKDELFSQIATGADEIRFPATKGIAGYVAKHRVVLNIPDAYADPRFNPDIDKKTGFRTRNMLTIPLMGHDDSLVGVLQVLNHKEGVFTDYDCELAEAFGAQTGVALQRAMLLEEYTAKKKLERDLDIAREIQKGTLPQVSPRIEGYIVAGWNRPADQTGGDSYDLIQLPSGQLGIMIADASGHGIGPALVVAECRAMLRAATCFEKDLASVTRVINKLLCEDLTEGRFITCFFGLFDPQRHEMDYISAGQAPILLVNPRLSEVQEIPSTDPPLGLLSRIKYEHTHRVRFRKGDILVLLTDGFYEWKNQAGEAFGKERVVTTCLREKEATPHDIISRLVNAVEDFAKDNPVQVDDLTAVILMRK